MSIDQFLFEVTAHYRSRGFPDSALFHLRWTLLSNVNFDTGCFCLKTAYPRCTKSIKELLGLFQPIHDADLDKDQEATAVFGFAFGYRMDEWLDGIHPKDELETRFRRRPGKNNEALAEIAERINRDLKLPLYLQFEIADAVTNKDAVKFSSSRKDQNTIAVAKEFVDHTEKNVFGKRFVMLLAHKHHYERCRIVLKRMGVQIVPIPEKYPRYDKYDEHEAQPRVMSAEENIVNDFASMAGMLGTRYEISHNNPINHTGE